MAVIKRANVTELARDAIVLDLGDLARQGEAIIAAARQRADEIVREAESERRRLVSTAADEGRRAGQERGVAEGRAAGLEEGRAGGLAEMRQRLEQLEQTWLRGLETFLAARERLYSDARQDVIRLAAVIAEKVTKRTIELDAGVVVAQMESVLTMVLRPTRLIVAVHPEDRVVLERAMPKLLRRFTTVSDAEVVEEPELERGGLVVRLGEPTRGESSSGVPGGELNASIAVQLGRLVDALLPPGRERGGESAIEAAVEAAGESVGESMGEASGDSQARGAADPKAGTEAPKNPSAPGDQKGAGA